MRNPSPLLALAALIAAAPAFAGPQCPAPGAGGASTNWGADYRERVQQIFDAAKSVAGDGLDPHLALIFINDLPKQGSTRLVEGSPLSAVEKGTAGLQTDAVIYTFGVFEIACDEAQLGTFMLHEMRHIKRGPDGKNHLDRVRECRKTILNDWISHTDLSAYDTSTPAGTKAAMDAFQKAKGQEVAVKCVKPVENEADAFALAMAPRLPWKVASEPADPNRDARVLAFKNAERWIDALGLPQDDPGHGTLGARAETAKVAAREAAMKAHQEEEKKRLQSFAPGF
jgi:hypothetical protein